MRFVSDVLNGVPSIVIGIAAYGLVVIRQKHFSALAGGVALAIMMVPTIARTTEQMLLLGRRAAEEKVAAFLLNLQSRYGRIGAMSVTSGISSARSE